MSLSAPSTPSAAPQAIPSNAPTGTWQHPQFDQIQKRMQKSRFDDRNVKIVLWNVALLVFTLFLPAVDSLRSLQYVSQESTPLETFTHKYRLCSPSFNDLAKTITPYTFYALWAVRLIPLSGIFYAIYPLLGPKDDLADIPLTPSQRSLLGLDPSLRPASPAIGNYVTPPRYARSITPSSNRSTGSPFSGRSSVGSAVGNAPYSPSASPLLHKAIGQNRRQSIGASASTGYAKAMNETSLALGANLNTQSPGGGGSGRGNASLGLNNKWLFEKGRGSPRRGGVMS